MHGRRKEFDSRDGGVSLTRRGSGWSNDAADAAQIALAGGGLMNKAG